jgi:hypothetical protein
MPDEETTVIISVDELKTRLRLARIDFSDYTDTDLESLITLTIKQIENETDLPILEPRTIVEFNKVSWSEVYVTDFYPIAEPSVTLNGQDADLKYIDNRNGILYFTTKQIGDLKVTYEIQYDNISLLQDLITDMIAIDIEGDSLNGQWNSIHEGDVSVSIGGNGSSLYEKVNDTLNNLSGYFKPRVKIL